MVSTINKIKEYTLNETLSEKSAGVKWAWVSDGESESFTILTKKQMGINNAIGKAKQLYL